MTVTSSVHTPGRRGPTKIHKSPEFSHFGPNHKIVQNLVQTIKSLDKIRQNRDRDSFRRSLVFILRSCFSIKEVTRMGITREACKGADRIVPEFEDDSKEVNLLENQPQRGNPNLVQTPERVKRDIVTWWRSDEVSRPSMNYKIKDPETGEKTVCSDSNKNCLCASF